MPVAEDMWHHICLDGTVQCLLPLSPVYQHIWQNLLLSKMASVLAVLVQVVLAYSIPGEYKNIRMQNTFDAISGTHPTRLQARSTYPTEVILLIREMRF